jgi:MFS family permease
MKQLKATNFTLMGALALSNILYTNLNSFYPTYMDEKHPELSTLHFGVIISAFGVSNFIASLWLGKKLSRFKRKNLIIKSFVLLFLSTFAFVFLDIIKPGGYQMFFYLSILLRIF